MVTSTQSNFRIVRLKRLVTVAALAILSPLTADAASQMNRTAPAHAYDFLIGRWSCANAMPSAIEGPTRTTFVGTRGSLPGSVALRMAGKAYDVSGYVSYVPRRNVWINPSAYGDGSYSMETSGSFGKHTAFTGSYHDPMGKMWQIRDMYTFAGDSTFMDVSQAQAGGKWRAVGRFTCTKTG